MNGGIMKETIYTIPINEAFEQRDGCPLCRLRRKLEHDSLDYILGAAMMEPDVREETNRQGFCASHYQTMLGMNRKLSLALTLESRLAQLSEYLDADVKKAPGRGFGAAKGGRGALHESAESCYVCNRIAFFEEHYYRNIFHMWKTMPQFHLLLMEQPYFCLRHAAKLIDLAPAALGKKEGAELVRIVAEMTKNYLSELGSDVSGFCKSFDYRSSGTALRPAQKNAPERAIEFLSGYRDPSEDIQTTV
jgi:hypothetical protein